MQSYTSKTLYGLENYLAEELTELGATDVCIGNRSVSFNSNKEIIYKINLCSRLALSILLELKEFRIKSDKDIYNALYNFEWMNYFKNSKTIFVETNVKSKIIRHSYYAGLLVKDAVVDYFKNKTGKRPSVNKDEPDIVIQLDVIDNKARISLNLSGHKLHKRGYRKFGGEAPINEVLAAGLVKISGWQDNTHFVDPFCGSGTIAIEAAMLANNIPSGYYRNKFSFFSLIDFDKKLWNDIFTEAKEGIKKSKNKIYASDISAKAFRIAKQNIESANLINSIKLSRKSFDEIIPVSPATIITNPPYGKRIPDTDLMNKFADFLFNNFQNTLVWIITPDKELFKNNFKNLNTIQLYNGNLQVFYHGFIIN
ncbi:MAG: hypothetical protein Kow0068_19420 [Marinilabiliales bacterium]